MFLSRYESSNTTSLFESRANQTPIDIAKTIFDSIVNTKTKSALTSEINESRIGKEIGKWDYGGEDFEESNYQFINIISISKNESYGVVYMFFTKPSPLSLRVKSKKVELLLLRKTEAMDISQRYPNIWMKFLKKSFYNTLSIKKITVNKIKYYWENLEKEKKRKKPIRKMQTDLNVFKQFKQFQLKNSDNDLFKNIKNHSNIKLRPQKSKSLGIKRIKDIKEMKKNKILNINKSSNSFSTNFSNKNPSYIDSAKKNIDINNSKNIIKQKSTFKSSNKFTSDNQQGVISSSKLTSDNQQGLKSPINKSCFNGHSNSKNRIGRIRKKKLNKLKIEIKKLKNSKNYYKKLCQTLTHSKGIDNNLFKSDFNNSLLTTLNHYNPSFKLAENINQNINIFHSAKPNIINNITIKNDNKFHFNSNFTFESQSSSDKKSPKKFILEEMKINNEINIFYKAKYINIENYTSGEFSKNEELRKQSLSFIKVFLEIEKKKNKKNIKRHSKISHINNNNKIENTYINNYDFRHILNKVNINRKQKDTVLNENKSIIPNNKKISNLYISNLEEDNYKYCLTLNKDKYSNNISKKYNPKKNNNKNKKFKKTIKESESCGIKKINNNDKYNSIFETKDKKENLGQLSHKIKTINEFENENENVLKKQINENENELSEYISFKSFDNTNENLPHIYKKNISYLNTNKSKENCSNLNSNRPLNNSSFQNK